MSELEDRLNAVLSDPAELSRLTQMASQLMGGLDVGAEGSSEPGESHEALPSILMRSLQSLRGRGKKPLVEGVAPYISQERRSRLEKALRLAEIAHTALPALQEMGGWDGL